MDIELLQFPYSTFNEKARWALDYKGIAHTRRNLLPGPHAFILKRLTGRTITPVVRFGTDHLDGSARIIEALEQRFPNPALYPADPALRSEALKIQAWVDEDIGPRTRRCILHHIIVDAGYTAKLFGEGQSLLTQRLYAATFPLARALIRRGNGITGPQSLQDGDAAMREALDFVTDRTRSTGYCVGDSFSVADLALAAILAGAGNPPGSAMERPAPRPPGLDAWVQQWAAHPGMSWMLDMYARHRRGPA
jgi:glutathione S-transferase